MPGLVEAFHKLICSNSLCSRLLCYCRENRIDEIRWYGCFSKHGLQFLTGISAKWMCKSIAWKLCSNLWHIQEATTTPGVKISWTGFPGQSAPRTVSVSLVGRNLFLLGTQPPQENESLVRFFRLALGLRKQHRDLLERTTFMTCPDAVGIDVFSMISSNRVPFGRDVFVDWAISSEFYFLRCKVEVKAKCFCKIFRHGLVARAS